MLVRCSQVAGGGNASKENEEPLERHVKTGGSKPGQENLESENPKFLKGNYLRIIKYFVKNLFWRVLFLKPRSFPVYLGINSEIKKIEKNRET